MLPTRIGWAIWALVPVAVVAYHYGPGQVAYRRDCAASLERQAAAAESAATEAQQAAYAQHLAAIEARRAALLAQEPSAESSALAAGAAEEKAYADAAKAWKVAADRYGEVHTALGETSPELDRSVRCARARALVRSGEIWTGIGELEGLLEELDTNGQGGTPVARGSREELATAYYYGARLLRLSGMPAQEWQVESGKARQQFRYLAENAREKGAEEASVAYQRNLELVLNLEQSSLVEIQGKPLPKDSPRTSNNANRPCSNCKKKGPKPPQKKDGRGAGGAEEIRDGW